jgi:tetratricopeptide (TPR) repeat protein
MEEAVGQPAKADAAIKAGGHFVDCYRFRADILDLRGNWPAAERAYVDAVAVAPDLPAAYYSWGVALARHHDSSGAIEKFAAANQRGPHWADPLKAWGDVLASKGKWREAVAQYEEALKYAPAWQALHTAHDAATRHLN